jgi:protocatechuate 3,4-dioxygenase beta subunit
VDVDNYVKSPGLSRRQALVLGACGVVYFALPNVARANPTCTVRPQQTEGPYFVDEELNRSDIRSDPRTGALKNGTPLKLTLAVSTQSGKNACSAVTGAQVDIWHCDAQGIYSDVLDPSFNTKGQKFLRGFQRTDSNGIVAFTTIYPGWYEGRAVHIHFKIRSAGHEFTSQIYFPDDLTDRVHAASYYRKPGHRTRNRDDGIFTSGGKDLILTPARTANGYAGTFSVGLM